MKSMMLDKQTNEYFLNSVADILSNTETSHKEIFLLLKKILSELFKKLTSKEEQYFSSDFARITYFFDKQRKDKFLASNIKKLYHFLSVFQKNANDYDSEQLKQIGQLINLFIYENSENRKELRNFDIARKINYSFLTSDSNFNRIKIIDRIYGVVNVIHHDENVLEIETNDSETVLFKPAKEWSEIISQVNKGNNINLINITEKDNFYTTTYNSLIIIEPDFLYDASEIAASFFNTGFVHQYFIYQKLIRSRPNLKMITGNVINYLFDAILYNTEDDFEKIYIQALKYKPLQVFAIARLDPEAKRILRETSHRHYLNLKRISEIYKDKLKSIEPHFISPVFGFQGRLDLMLEYLGENDRKDVIELKSGKVPRIDEKYFANGSVIKTGLYLNHFAQATIYNLLLDSTYSNRTGSSQILYSSDEQYPLRNAPNVMQIKIAMVKARNRTFVAEQRLCTESLFIKQIELAGANNIPPWVLTDIDSFKDFYDKLPFLEKLYFDYWIKFIYNELFTARIGNSSDKQGYSSLWRSTTEEKRNNNSIISNLIIDIAKSDFEKMHINFNIGNDEIQMYPFRKGDLCIIYPDEETPHFSPRSGRLIKGAIKEITADSVTITLRNKLEFNVFRNLKQRWILDADYTDASIKSLFASLYTFINSEPDKKALILGLREPSIKTEMNINLDYLSEQQNRILNMALNANDYYLIQGPPGTGKTSFILRSIVESLYFNTGENLLILAYTNRAVDEICSALERISFTVNESRTFPEFIRLGNKDSTPYKNYLLSELIDNTDINVAYKEFSNTRIIIATSSFVLSNMEIFNIKHFNTIIVDEASQITEVNLNGILTQSDKFIMIGDEKQLPAIILQDESKIKLPDELINEIEFNESNISIFERLLTVCKRKGWSHAYDMLEYQARMHNDLMKIPNELFYDNRLQINGFNWQKSEDNIFKNFVENGSNPLTKKLINLLSKHRFIFINVPEELHSKYNLKEAELAVQLTDAIKTTYNKEFTNESLGIISPFRMQCSVIFKKLDEASRRDITIDTVEKFQGSERDIIIFSLATNNEYLLNNIQSLSSVGGRKIDKKLNVSITRAKTHLIILGSAAIVNKSNFYNYLINYSKELGSFYHIEDLMS